MPSTILPITIPDKQLPDPARRLSSGFVKANGRPAGLWLPSKLAKAAADFSGNRNFGTLNGGVTTTGDGWGVLSSSWKTNGSTGYVSLPANAKTAVMALTGKGTIALVLANNNPSQTNTFALEYDSTGALNVFNIIYGFTANTYETFWNNGGGSGRQTIKSGVTDSRPHLIVCTLNYPTLTTYYDGVQTGSFTLSQSLDTSTPLELYLGQSNGSRDFFAGGFYAYIEFDSALSAAQVSALYSSLLCGEPYRLFDQTANERFIGNIAATGGLLLARRRAAAA